MSTSKHFSAVCALVFVLALIVTVLFMNGERLGIRVIRDEDAEESEAPVLHPLTTKTPIGRPQPLLPSAVKPPPSAAPGPM